jgi:hypothetical protein
MNDEELSRYIHLSASTTPVTSARAVPSSVERRRRLPCLPRLDLADGFPDESADISNRLVRTSLPAAVSASLYDSAVVTSEACCRSTDSPCSFGHSASTNNAAPPPFNHADTAIATNSWTMQPDGDGASSVDSARALVLVSGLSPHASDDIFKRALSIAFGAVRRIVRVPSRPAQRIVEFAHTGAAFLALRCMASQPLQLGGGVALVIEPFDSDQYDALLSESALDAAPFDQAHLDHPRQHQVLPLPHESPASAQFVLPTPLVSCPTTGSGDSSILSPAMTSSVAAAPVLTPPLHSAPLYISDVRVAPTRRRRCHIVNEVSFGIDAAKIIDGSDTRSSVMIRNIPNKYTQRLLLATLNVLHSGEFDFLYLPIDFDNQCNLGYAFLNFVNYRSILDLMENMNGKRWPRFSSTKVCAITYARIQGKDSLISHFKRSHFQRPRGCVEESERPLFRHSAAGELLPLPLPMVQSVPTTMPNS